VRVWEVVEPGGPSGLGLADRPDPVPGPREVILQTRAVALNHRDLLIVGGRYQRDLPPHTVPCSDAAGEVVQVGSEVASVKVGDRVTSTFVPEWRSGPYSLRAAKSALGAGATPGVLAERVVLPEYGVLSMPAWMSFEQACTLPCAGLTAWHALFEEGPSPPATTVLTMGTGGVSVFAAQFARRSGARVIATSSRDAKLERLAELGVHDTINYTDVERWGERARELTGGVGVDQVIDVGGPGTLEQSTRAVRFGGTISVIGVLARDGPVSLVPVLMRNLRLQGVMVGSREMFERMNRSLDNATLEPVIDSVFEFARAPAAFEHLASGSHFGKVVIRC
jgi:NADPH:quinone reductase-like Zn-dependent oxidoreductase